jgi:hypothetical protein
LAASQFVILVSYSLGAALLELFLILLLRTVARRDWLAISLYVLINAVAYSNGQWQSILAAGLIFSLYALMLTRFGLFTVKFNF